MTPGLRTAAAGLGALLAGPALAHSPIPGIGHFYNGMLHPALVPAHALALLAMGLWLGQRGVASGGLALAAFSLALPAGLALATVLTVADSTTDALLLAIGGSLALSVAAARSGPRWLSAALALVMGLALGLGSLPDKLSSTPLWLSLAGTWLGATLVIAWVAALQEWARRDWMRLGMRVVGSWLAASALIVLALAWVGPRRAAAVETPDRALAAPAATPQAR